MGRRARDEADRGGGLGATEAPLSAYSSSALVGRDPGRMRTEVDHKLHPLALVLLETRTAVGLLTNKEQARITTSYVPPSRELSRLLVLGR